MKCISVELDSVVCVCARVGYHSELLKPGMDCYLMLNCYRPDPV